MYLARVLKSIQKLNYVKLNNNPGPIAEKISPLVVSTTDCKIIEKVDMQSYFEAGHKLLAQGKTILLHCNNLLKTCSHEQKLSNSFEAIEDTLRQAERILELLLGLAGNRERPRRAILPFVGEISRYLFGTLNEDSERKLKQLIKSTASDTKQTAKLLAEQTELVVSQFTSIDENVKKFNFGPKKDIIYSRLLC